MRKRQAERLMLAAFGLIIFVLGLGAKMINESLHLSLLNEVSLWAWGIGAVTLFLLLVAFLLENRIYKGVRYFWFHWTLKNRLEHQMLDAGFGIRRNYYIELPKVQISLNKDFSSGVLKIKNALKFDRKLDDVVMSSALGKFVVEYHYGTDDGNYYIYELVDGSVSFKLHFDTFDDFLLHNAAIPPYQVYLDSRSVVKLQHVLLVGLTGSGKTYELYSLILQMLNKPIEYVLYFADPKGSSLAVMGNAIAPDKTSVDVDSIIDLLEEFVKQMRVRKAELQERLRSRIDADYSDFGMIPYVFICDEYASFASVLAASDKKKRDEVKALLYEIILQGRQLGFFLFLIMQKSDATLVDTALRDNLTLKIVLGNSEQQTYVTAFGAGADIPKRHYAVGEGVFTEPVLAPEPKLVQCPYFKFDILKALKACPRWVTTGAPDKH